MFGTAFVWGLGVSCGACFGLLMFLILKAGLDWLMGTETVKAIEDQHKRTCDLLEDRNRISSLMLDRVTTLAVVADLYQERANEELQN